LKLDNLLVSSDWTVKVSDFGVSVEMEEGDTYDRFGGNVKYSAPEILAVKYPHLSGVKTKKFSKTFACSILTDQ
jgi:serine/threonine protein kinase